jgi:serine/threonine protein kinase
MICKEHPFYDFTADCDVMGNICDRPFSFAKPIWSTISDDAKQFITLCLEKNKMKRQDAQELLSHAWFKDKKV